MVVCAIVEATKHRSIVAWLQLAEECKEAVLRGVVAHFTDYYAAHPTDQFPLLSSAAQKQQSTALWVALLLRHPYFFKVKVFNLGCSAILVSHLCSRLIC
jgi:hypothetical protein